MILKFSVIFAIIILLSNFDSEAIASPVFGPQILKDPYSEMHLNRISEQTVGSDHTNFFKVTYSSDGKTLQSVFWLKGNFPESSQTDIHYMILLDADFNKESGINGIDYGKIISFESGEWFEKLVEFSVVQNNEEKKIFERTMNKEKIKNFQLGTSNSLKISFDLEAIGSPDQYRILFASAEKTPGEPELDKFDYSSWVMIPKPEFLFTVIPNTITIRNDETKNVEVKIEATPPSEYDVRITSTDGHEEGLMLSFPDRTLITKQASIPIQIKIDETIDDGLHPITITTQAKEFQENIEQIGSLDFDQTSLIPSTIGTRSFIFSEYSEFQISVMVEPPLTFEQQLVSGLDPWEGPVSIFTALAGLGGGFVFWAWKKRHPEKR